jgi:hypothetical protein
MKKIPVKMNNFIRTLLAASFLLLIVDQAQAERYKYDVPGKSYELKATAAGCSPSSAFEWLDINNVRARVNAGGDMWWDLPGGTGAKYYIPKSGTATSMFSGALWIGGLDINNQLKLAAQRYRQVGIDFWTGPLTIDGTAAIDEQTCAQFDKQWKMTRAIVDEFLANTDPETGAFIPSDDYTIPSEMLEWPAHGDVAKNQSYYLAPFYDVDGDGEYNPTAGDYPYYDLDNSLCNTKTPTMDESIEGAIWGSVLADQVIKGDQTIWWVFNDKGNVKTETGGAAIGMEIRAQAFAFATNDEVNNMTFYSYEIINRSTFELTQTYFSLWVDPDLGKADDDFTGCDIGRGLGYVYNGTAVDGSGEPESYGAQPPAIGVDFFQGPYMDANGLDNPKFDANGNQLCDESINGVNFGNGIIDDERFGMRRFIYHNNSSGELGDPQTAPQYYNYLRGRWKNGRPMEYGGNAFPGGPGTVGPQTDFMFPGSTDPCNWGTGGQPPNPPFDQPGVIWTEEFADNGAPNPPGDRRFMQSAGPFTLKPGAVNYITVGIPWARAISGGPYASVELLRRVDDKAQALFENCFKVIDGPNAPDLSFQELDRELIVYISNSPSSNNYKEQYVEYDPNIPAEFGDTTYVFEGYQIFQLRNASVGVESIQDPDQVRLVAQFDVKNGVGRIINHYLDENLGFNQPVLEVDGGDNGIRHSFRLTQDAFATGDVRLVNHKQYYFMALAYAYNEYKPYGENVDDLDGQKLSYLAGRRNIQTYTAIPAKTINGLVTRADYGEQPQITRLAGHGNGGLVVDLTPETTEEILSKPPVGPDTRFGDPDYPIAYTAAFKAGRGPLNVKVIDPLNVVGADYELWFDTLRRVQTFNVTGEIAVFGDTSHKEVGNWYLRDLATNEIFESDTTIIANDEQLFLDRGISIQINQPYKVGPISVGTDGNPSSPSTLRAVLATNNGLLESNLIYADSSRRWLTGIQDVDIPGFALNWIRSGIVNDQENGNFNDWNMPGTPWDPEGTFETVLNGTWAPYAMTAWSGQSFVGDPGPAFNVNSKSLAKFGRLASIDIVLTPDKSKWTRSPVIEMGLFNELNEGGTRRFTLRKAPSVDKDGNPAESMTMSASDNPDDPNYIGSFGMGWFPGYAINVETGERLNIVFGENSFLSGQNGRDMLFNPTARDLSTDQFVDPNVISPIDGSPRFGGMHYVYIMGHDETPASNLPDSLKFKSPAYDAGRYAHKYLRYLDGPLYQVLGTLFYQDMMWVGMPMAVKGEEWLSNDAHIRIRMAKPYARNYSTMPLDTVHPGMDLNNFYPMFAFSTKGMESEQRNAEKLESDLDLINVVPNPYYAYSSYERNALDNRVKITNLPEKCVVTIYNMSGTKVRQFSKDQTLTSIDWDLKNFAGVPIASGIYLIHVKAPEGERVIKWFGTMRPIDLNTF